MKFLFLLTMLMGLPGFGADVTYTTSVGAVFTQIQGPRNFGKAWRSEGLPGKPDGTVWSSYQGDYSNSAIQPDQNGVAIDTPATETCAKIGGTLPTLQDYKNLASYFEVYFDWRSAAYLLTDQGKKDLYIVFPDTKDRWFWSSSIFERSDSIWGFFGGGRGGLFIDSRELKYSVYCVGH